MEEITLITSEDVQEIKERIREQKQIERNAQSFVSNYFRFRSYSVQNAVKEAYLKIVRDKILF
jgi:hypothetical protein